MRRPSVLVAIVLLVVAVPVSAQTLTDEQKAQRLRERWTALFQQLVTEQQVELVGADGKPVTALTAANRVAGSEDDRRAFYKELIRRLMADPGMSPFFEVDVRLVEQESGITDQQWIARLAESGAGENAARSVNATLTNPAAPPAAERSGLASLVALALDTRNVLSANESAVTVNFSALALTGLQSATRSAPALYRDRGFLRRLGGSFTFGAKIPEGEITGLTGLPSAETIFDAFSWDAKVRVVGDRDPRAAKWYDLMLGYMGGLNEISANVLASVLADDRTLVAGLLRDVIQHALVGVRDRLGKSIQIAVKIAGQHLAKEVGKNKYTYAVMLDKGFGDTSLTANLAYAAVDNVAVNEGSAVTVKTLSAAFAVNSLVARDALIQGRATELSINAKVDAPVGDLPIDRKTVWHIVGGISLPWGDAASVPISVTFTNDPNNLQKQKFVRGYIGLAYDFSALKSLFKPLTTPR
jgi:hypothetical protein